MRTYAPADPSTVLDRPRSRSRRWPAASSTTRSSRRARRVYAPMPGWLDPRIVAGLGGARHRAAVHPPGGGDRGGPRRRGRRRRHADRVGQDAVLRPARPAGDRGGSGRPRAVPVPDQGARPGPGGGVRGALARRPGCRSSPSTYDGDTPAPDPVGRPGGRAGRRHQPGHAPLGDPAAPHEVVPAVRAAAGSSSSTSCTPTAACSAATSPTSCGGCCGSARTTAATRSIVCCSATIGNPRRARGDADRPAGPARRPQRRAGRRAARPARRPAGARAGQRRARLGR